MDLKSKRTAGFGLLAMSIALFMTVSSANAATLNVVGGQLLGALGVVVDGSSYNVEFLDGSCIELYGGCDEVSDFTFQTQAAALLASQALLDQVFLDGADLFDSVPELTTGCESPNVCAAVTPYGLGAFFNSVSRAFNDVSTDSTLITSLFAAPSNSFLFSTSLVYAVWTPVPEPGTALLMGLGLTALAARRKI